MCGIAGILSRNPQLVQQPLTHQAAATLKHRGPDAEGFFINQNQTAALGHTRLQVVDSSPAAAQPLTYRSRFTIVFNGELYNYEELKKVLGNKGHHFVSESDTEVVVAAFAEMGSRCLQHFDGAFAFAIWDELTQELFAARDRFGEKPFFFHYTDAQFAFASEAKALWAMGFQKEVNRAMLYNFLSVGYTTNPFNPMETFFENLQQLPPACFLSFSLPDHRLQTEVYWQLHTQENNVISEAAAIEQFRHLFAASVRKQMRSQVPVGVTLSGGLDSSAVVAFCCGSSLPFTHKCFTASFPDFSKDELAYAQQVADAFGLNQLVTSIAEKDLVPLMHRAMWHQEAPIASGSALAQFALYKLARENGVTVLLDGQGADEVLAGYVKYYKWYWLELYRKRKLKGSNELAQARALGVPVSFNWKEKIAALFPEFSASLLQSQKAKKAFKNPDLNPEFAFAQKRNLYYSMPAFFTLNSALHFNTVVNGLEELLRMADRNSMAHGIEVRLPFLDHHLVQFLFSLPSHFKIHEGWTKWLLRKTVAKQLPQNIVWRKDKVGFEPPQKQWMQHADVQHAIAEAKKVLVKEEILQPGVLRKKIQPHDAHAAENNDWKYWSAAFLFA